MPKQQKYSVTATEKGLSNGTENQQCQSQNLFKIKLKQVNKLPGNNMLLLFWKVHVLV